MQHNYLKDKFVVIVLLGVSAFLGIMILVKVRGFFVTSAWAENIVKRAVAQTKPDANDMEKYFAKSKTIAEELKKKNLFVPPQQKKHPVSQVSGILGDEVLINGKWYKVGDKVGGAKIVAIEPTQVKIEWEGKEKVFDPISCERKDGAEKDSGASGETRGRESRRRTCRGGPARLYGSGIISKSKKNALAALEQGIG